MMRGPVGVTRGGLAVLLGWTLTSCAGLPSLALQRDQLYAGHLSLDQRSMPLFRPCGGEVGDTLWLARFYGQAAEQLERLSTTGVLRLPQPAFVRIYAQISSTPPVGLLLSGVTREIHVQDVIETRPSGACPSS